MKKWQILKYNWTLWASLFVGDLRLRIFPWAPGTSEDVVNHFQAEFIKIKVVVHLP
jgi:hypothetical protein